MFFFGNTVENVVKAILWFELPIFVANDVKLILDFLPFQILYLKRF